MVPLQSVGYQQSHGPSVILLKRGGKSLSKTSAQASMTNYETTEKLPEYLEPRTVCGNHRGRVMNIMIKELTPKKIESLRLEKTAAIIYANLSVSLARCAEELYLAYYLSQLIRIFWSSHRW